MNRAVRQLVRSRAAMQCEYCQLHEFHLPRYRFHIEPILPRKNGATNHPDQLAWSCQHCNLSQSSNLSGRDILTGRVAVLFNPRRQRWKSHVEWHGASLNGLTPCGRATIAVLNINAEYRIILRKLLIDAGLFPPE